MLLAVLADKGSPGVTTAALALAAAAVGEARGGGAPGPVLLVEADPGGGDLECWCGPLGAPGLLAAVTDVGDAAGCERLRGHAVEVVEGVDAVVAPTSAGSMAAALQAAGRGFVAALAALAGTVIVDCGRWQSPAPPLLDLLLAEADLALVACRPTLGGVEHTRSLLPTLRPAGGRVEVVLAGGDRPYGPGEVSAALGATVAGVLPWDPRGVTALAGRGAGRAFLRSALGMAAAELLRRSDRTPVGPGRVAAQEAGRRG